MKFTPLFFVLSLMFAAIGNPDSHIGKLFGYRIAASHRVCIVINNDGTLIKNTINIKTHAREKPG